jgi:hypothetical protein
MAGAGVVGHHRQAARALFDQPLDQRIGLADRPEPTDQHHRPVADARHGLGHGAYDLVDHVASFSPAPR